MNSLFLSNNLRVLNITPFKFCLCSIINDLMFKTSSSHEIGVFDAVFFLINDFKNEISLKILKKKLQTIFNFLKLRFKDDESNYSERKEDFFNILDEIYDNIISPDKINPDQRVLSINKIYEFFNCKLRELKNRLKNGGYIDIFLRKCHVAFYRMDFEDLTKLFERTNQYFQGNEINIPLTLRESQYLFEKQLNEFSYFSNNQQEKILNLKLLNFQNYKHKYYFVDRISQIAKEEKDSKKKLLTRDLSYEDTIIGYLNPNSENYVFSSHEKNYTNLISDFENIYRFFDYNIKYFYNNYGNQNENKIQYSMIKLVEHNYENNFYSTAIQILFECIKLTQKECDHEGLIKCFLWMQKIYQKFGNYEIAKKCLSSCLVKSFESNFNLIYLISSFEYSKLNFLFGIEDQKSNRKEEEYITLGNSNFDNLEKKILFFSENSIYSYKTLFQHISNPKETKIDGLDLKIYITYINLSFILNLLRKGHINLALTKLKFLLENENLIYYSNKEIIEVIQNILYETFEFDLDESVEYFISFYKKNLNFSSKNLKEENVDNKKLIHTKENTFDYLVKMIKTKLYSISQNKVFLERNNFNLDEKIQNNIFTKLNMQYLSEFSILDCILSNKEKIIELKKFIKTTKIFKIYNLYFLAKIKLAKIYSFTNLNKATIILMKLKDKVSNENIILKVHLLDCFINLKYKNYKQIKNLMKFIINKNILRNSGSLEDEYDFYYFQMLLLIEKINKNISKFYNLKEIFLLWCQLLNLSMKLFNKNKIFDLLEIFYENFGLNTDNINKMRLNFKIDNETDSSLSKNVIMKKPDIYLDYHFNDYSIKNNIILFDVYKIFQPSFKQSIYNFINEQNELNDKLISLLNESALDFEEELEVIYILKEHNKSFENEFSKLILDLIKQKFI